MAVMDEFKEERAAMKNAPLKKKWEHFWYYYKWYVFGIVLTIVMAVFLIYQLVNQKDTAFNAVMLNAISLTEDNTYTEEFAKYAGIDTNEYDVIFDTTFQISEDAADEMSYTMVQKLMTYTAAGELDVMVTSADCFTTYAHNNCFYDMREFLNAEQLAKYEPYFYYVDQKVIREREAALTDLKSTFIPTYPDPTKPEEMEEPIPVGIYVDSNDKLLESFYFGSNGNVTEHVVLGVYVTTQHPETAMKYLAFAFEE